MSGRGKMRMAGVLSVLVAMLMATEKQRQEQALGRKGVTNGWGFWKA